jgi:hypothetical protein
VGEGPGVGVGDGLGVGVGVGVGGGAPGALGVAKTKSPDELTMPFKPIDTARKW